MDASTASNLIPVLFASDRNYIQHAAACIASLVENNPGFSFDILVVGTQDFGPLKDRLSQSFAGNERVNIRFQIFDFPNHIHFPLPYHLTQETYVRFWIGDLFKDYERALYLDPDTIVSGSIAELWRTDLQGRAIGAVPIPGSIRPQQHGMPAGSLFFNAGVMLFDLTAWRARSYGDKCLDFLRDHPEKALDGDQDILNLCLQKDWLPLPFRWNVIGPFYRLSHDLKLSMAQVEEIRRDASIIHYNGGAKPWSYMSEHPRKADYWKYLRLTGWRDVKPDDYTMANVLRKSLAPLIPRPVKRAIKAMVS